MEIPSRLEVHEVRGNLVAGLSRGKVSKGLLEVSEGMQQGGEMMIKHIFRRMDGTKIGECCNETPIVPNTGTRVMFNDGADTLLSGAVEEVEVHVWVKK
jgi:hypothetical protein